MVRYDPYTDRFIMDSDSHMISRPTTGRREDGDA